MLSVIIPVYVEPYLNKTITSLLDNAQGEIEIIPVFDGCQKAEAPPNDRRVRPELIERAGMRAAVNHGLNKASGDWIMKIDAHCCVSPGYDKILTQAQENWLEIPRMYQLNENTWTKYGNGQAVDYHYVSYPGIVTEHYGNVMLTPVWLDYPAEWNEDEIGDTMAFQGSCWVANKEYFVKYIYPLDDRPETYGPFIEEQKEIGMKYWMGGGAVKVNKKTWYGHLRKGRHHYNNNIFVHFQRKNRTTIRSINWATQHWMNNREPNMVRKMDWLIDKFWPVPTWPENWREDWAARC